MVCLGNICRSPLAEGIARHLITQRNLDWTVDSAGTIDWHQGSPPDKRSIEVGQLHEIDISGLRARKITLSDLDQWDIIITMDAQNYQDVKRIDPVRLENKLFMMMNFLYPGQNRPVPDPYYGGKKEFESVYEMLFQACNAMIDELQSMREPA